jgi:hypothetical protein
MKYRQRTFYTDSQKSEMWDRWQRGESLSSIGRGFNRASSSIYPLLARTGFDFNFRDLTVVFASMYDFAKPSSYPSI